MASTLGDRRQHRVSTSPWSISTCSAGITGGLVIIGALSAFGGLITSIDSLPDGTVPWIAFGILNGLALLVGVALAIWRPSAGLAASTIAGLTAAITLALLRVLLLEGKPYNPLIFGWPGIAGTLILTPLAGLLGSRLGGERLHQRFALSEAAQTGIYAALIWLSIESTARMIGGLGLGQAIGNVVAGDMLAVMIGMPAAARLIALYGQRHGIRPRDWAYSWSPTRIAIGAAGGLLILALMSGTALVDQALWGASGALPPTMVEGLRAGAWVGLLMLVVNGVIGPASEELAWRGVTQTAFGRAWGLLVGLLVTTILFALKHVVLDGSVARVTTLLMLGLVVGAIRIRWETGSSTISHIVANIGATSLILWTISQD